MRNNIKYQHTQNYCKLVYHFNIGVGAYKNAININR